MNSDEEVLAIKSSDEQEVILEASPRGPIKDTEQLALLARPYGTEPEAVANGQRWRRILEKAFARCNVGADFGDRTPTGAATAHYLALLSAEHGVPRPQRHPRGHGVRVRATPLFIRHVARGVVGKEAARLLDIVRAASTRDLRMSDVEQLAYEFVDDAGVLARVQLRVAVTVIRRQPRLQADLLLDQGEVREQIGCPSRDPGVPVSPRIAGSTSRMLPM